MASHAAGFHALSPVNLEYSINILAIIPARGGSKGLPRKNVLPLAGIPLIGHTIAAAKQSQFITSIVVNTDDDEIAAIADRFGVMVQRRPSEMGSDTAKVDALLIWAVKEFEKTVGKPVDIVVLLYPTAPLRPSQAIDQTVELVTKHQFDSALSLVEDTSYLWTVQNDGTASPSNYDPKNRAPRQQESWNQWRENKAIYVTKRDLLIDSGCRLGGRMGHYPMSPLHSLDIDDADDLALAEAILVSERVPKPELP